MSKARKADPLAEWRKRMQPTSVAQGTFEAIRAILAPFAGNLLRAGVQEMPPKYVLTVSPGATLHQDEDFASVAAITDTVYFDLFRLDDAFHKKLVKLFGKRPYLVTDGFELTGALDAKLRAGIAALVTEAFAKIGGAAAADLDVKLDPRRQTYAVPKPADWKSSAAWVGPKLQAVKSVKQLGRDTVFARCTIHLEIVTARGVGMKRLTEKTLNGLIEVESGSRGKPLQVLAAHAVGLDKQMWSFRRVTRDGREFMPLFVGKSFAAQSVAAGDLLEKYALERVTIQSVLPGEDGRVLRRELRETFEIDLDSPEDEIDAEDD